MSDRELLELAAKAAGLQRCENYYTDAAGNHVDWNPLADDGDVFRLMVKSKFHVGINPGNKVFCTPTYSDKPTVFESCERDGAQDSLAATRRAIVRAAAEIGRRMS